MGLRNGLRWTLYRGGALVEQEQGEEGIAQLRQGLAALRAAGTVVGTSYYLSQLAEASGNIGQPAEGLSAIAEALTFVHTTGERLWEAKLYRLKGELLLQAGDQGPESGVSTPDARLPTRDAEAAACFHQALDIARRQQARSLQLRAAISLIRLW